jgi:hypothetical protein
MTVRADLLSVLPDRVADTVRLALPDLQDCRGVAGRYNLEELKRDTILAPAVLISLLGARQDIDWTGPENGFLLSMAAFVVTRDRLGLRRDAAALNICQALMALIPNMAWGMDALGPARRVRADSLITVATRSSGASLWAVTWDQPAIVAFTEPAAQPLDPRLYLGLAPEIGFGHEDDYQQVGGVPA